MAKEKKAETKKTYFELGEEWSVANCRKLDFGKFFTLKVKGASFYNLRVVPAGEDYAAFISCPDSKGSDGEWYPLFKIYFTKEDTKAIIKAVNDALKKEKEEDEE